MDEEEIEKRVLAFRYTNFTTTAANVQDFLRLHPSYRKHPRHKEYCNDDLPDWIIDIKRIVRGKNYDVDDFVEQCVHSFCNVANVPIVSLKRAPTPFIDDSKDPKDWNIFLPRDAECEDQSPRRQKCLEQLGDEIKCNMKSVNT